MKIGRVAGLLFRLGVLVAVLAAGWFYRDGLADVVAALRTAGWTALFAMSGWHLIPFLLCAVAELVLVSGIDFSAFLLTRWVHEAVSELAGFIPLSGELAAGRTLTRRGVPSARAAALTVVDLTCEALAEFAFIVIGIALWLIRHPAGAIVHWALIGIGVIAPLLLAFMFIQRSPVVRFIETLPSRLMPKTVTAPEEKAGTLAAPRRSWA